MFFFWCLFFMLFSLFFLIFEEEKNILIILTVLAIASGRSTLAFVPYHVTTVWLIFVSFTYIPKKKTHFKGSFLDPRDLSTSAFGHVPEVSNNRVITDKSFSRFFHTLQINKLMYQIFALPGCRKKMPFQYCYCNEATYTFI